MILADHTFTSRRVRGYQICGKPCYISAILNLPADDPLRDEFKAEFQNVPADHKLAVLATYADAKKHKPPRHTTKRFWKAAARKCTEAKVKMTSKKHPRHRLGVKGPPPILKYLRHFDIVRQVNNDGAHMVD